LNFDEGADLRVISDLAAVEIYKVVNLDVSAKPDVWRDRLKMFSTWILSLKIVASHAGCT
jgi:hypothetical protein